LDGLKKPAAPHYFWTEPASFGAIAAKTVARYAPSGAHGERLGSNGTIRIDFRLAVATAQDLSQALAARHSAKIDITGSP
jgi:hypothetical protein